MTRALPDPGTLALGVATASYQIEGATREDGRGPSIWDTFTARKGTIRDASDGSTACDSYHRLEEDLDLVKGLGVDYYRFSVAWSRVIPDGRGRVESRGLDYYERLVDGLLARGVAPALTLYHWDLPQPLEDAGGWLERGTAEAFAAYAEVVYERLGDRVGLWTTHNEPWCSAYLGYAAGVHAPGHQLGGQAHVAAHHLMLGHGLAAAALRSAGAASVGIVLNLEPVWPEREEAAAVADGVDAVHNRVWLDPLIDGEYDAGLLSIAPELSDPAVVRPGDLELIQGSADWLGVNYYTPVRPDLPGDGPHPANAPYPGVAPFSFAPREPRTDIGWEVEARGLEELMVETYRRTGLPLLITENGAAYADPAVEGYVDDQDRIAYLADHLAATERARSAGADIRAYFVWTLLDNFEWAEGYTKTFGIVHVDPADQRRTPKASFRWFTDYVAKHHEGVEPPTP